MARPDPAVIARRLTPAMRDGLLRQPCPSWWGSAPAAMPHSKSTARALSSRGLVVMPLLWRHSAYPLTPLGEQVRDCLHHLPLPTRHGAGLHE